MQRDTSLDANADSERQPEWFDGDEDRPLDEWMRDRAADTGRALSGNVLRQFEGNAKRCRSRLEFARQQLEEEPLREFQAPIIARIEKETRTLLALEREIATWRAKVG
jgi:hypothetical protein